MYVYIYIYIYMYMYVVISIRRTFISFARPSPGGKARVQNGVSGSFLGAIFEVVAGTKSEVWTNL